MNNSTINSILEIVKSCDSLILATCDGKYPDARHVTNAMNRENSDLALFLMTGRDTPKFKQLTRSPECCLYYFNPANRHAVRLYGEIEFIDDMNTRQNHWKDEYSKFGYGGPTDSSFILMRVNVKSYKYYTADGIQTGII